METMTNTMLDFSEIPVIDNHCHPLDPKKAVLSSELLAREFYHGLGDLPLTDTSARLRGISQNLGHHIQNLGVVQTLVRQLSMVLGCEADLETVSAERNRRASEDFALYCKMLYNNARIKGTVLDSDLPSSDPGLALIPSRLMRLFQMGPPLRAFLKTSTSYQELLQRYREALDQAVKKDGYVGVKAHLAEEVGFGAGYVTEAEAGASFALAKAGDPMAYRKLYTAVFTATMLQCQELRIPVHVHSGTTGGLWNGPVSDADPFLLVPLLRRPELIQTRVILLHGAYPWIQHAAAVAHALPHVWVDMGWTTPWISLRIVECYRDLVGMAPLSKLMIGSGGHGIPEIAWLSAKTAKIALGKMLGESVELGLMGRKQAENAGRMILYENATRLYHIKENG
ncbi:amidohydrolase family protein [Candidatus Bathyarchaeota archaeon]|nr:amidohydrolase family protein [Candidatus Bathyarchaeota archaeon]